MISPCLGLLAPSLFRAPQTYNMMRSVDFSLTFVFGCTVWCCGLWVSAGITGERFGILCLMVVPFLVCAFGKRYSITWPRLHCSVLDRANVVHPSVRFFADHLAAERPPSSRANGGSGYSEGRERDQRESQGATRVLLFVGFSQVLVVAAVVCFVDCRCV